MTKRIWYRFFYIIAAVCVILTLTLSVAATSGGPDPSASSESSSDDSQTTSGEPETTDTTPLTAPPSVTNFTVEAGAGAKSEYHEGETFNPAGYTGTITYSDGSEKTIPSSGLTFSPSGALSDSNTQITFHCADTDIFVGRAITVHPITDLIIDTMPSNTTYYATQTFSSNGLKLKVKYSDNTTSDAELENCTFSANAADPLTHDVTAVTVTYVLGSHSFNTDINITVKPIVSLRVTGNPTTAFFEGDSFDPAGLVVLAKYDDNHELNVTDFLEIPLAVNPLAPDADSEYTTQTLTAECDGASVDFKVDVTAISEFLITPYSGIDYYYGDAFDKNAFTVKAVYTDGSEKDVTSSVVFDAPAVIAPGSVIKATYLGHELDLPIILHTAVALDVITAPTKTEYKIGESFAPAGMKIAVKYDNNISKQLADTDYTVVVNSPLETTDSAAKVQYAGLEISVGFTVLPEKPIDYIEIINQPDTIKYVTNQKLSIDGMVVIVHYRDDTLNYDILSNDKLIITPAVGTPMTTSITSFTVTYKISDTLQYTAKQNVSVEKKETLSLSIISKPTKMTYNEGEKFSATGLVVNAVYNDGTSSQITSYTVTPTDPFLLTENKATQVNITISYGNCQCVLPVTVKPKAVKSITVQTLPTKTSYKVGDVFDPAGMLVTLTYSDETIAIVQNDAIGWGPTGTLKESNKTITITYRGLSTELAITVTGNSDVTQPPETTTPDTGTQNPGSETTVPDVTTAAPGSNTASPGTTSSPDTGSNPGSSTAVVPPETLPNSHGNDDGPNTMMILWIVILAVIVIALVVLIVYYKKNFT